MKFIRDVGQVAVLLCFVALLLSLFAAPALVYEGRAVSAPRLILFAAAWLGAFATLGATAAVIAASEALDELLKIERKREDRHYDAKLANSP